MARRKNKTKWAYWLIVLALFIVAGAVAYSVWNSYFGNKGGEVHTDNTTQVAENKKTNDSADNNEQSNDKSEDGQVLEAEKEKEKVAAYEGADPNKSDELTGVVTYAGVNGSTLMVRVNIDQYLDSGVCELSLQGSGMYSDTANIVGSAATSTCEGFNVSMGELEPGAYQIVIRVSSGDKSGTIRGAVDI